MAEKKRIPFVDIAKGIGILLVVLGHSRQPDDPVIFAVHMPLFFCISGYLYSAGGSVGNFVGRKFRGLYVPFVFWNCVFVLLSAAFGWYGMTWAKAGASCGWIVALCEKSNFLGATWFLAGMFGVTILYRLLDLAFSRLDDFRRRLVLALVFVGISAAAFSYKLPGGWSRPLVLSVFFGVGAFVRALEEKVGATRLWRWWVVPAALAVFFPIALTQTAHQGPNVYSSPVLFVVAGLCGTYAIVWLCRLMDGAKGGLVAKLSKGLTFLGRNSLDIVIWHFVVFRFIVMAEILIAGEPFTSKNVLAHYPVYSSEGWRWIVYLALGTAVPLAWCALLRRMPFVKRVHLA